jgi:hypothetical protein
MGAFFCAPFVGLGFRGVVGDVHRPVGDGLIWVVVWVGRWFSLVLWWFGDGSVLVVVFVRPKDVIRGRGILSAKHSVVILHGPSADDDGEI